VIRLAWPCRRIQWCPGRSSPDQDPTSSATWRASMGCALTRTNASPDDVAFASGYVTPASAPKELLLGMRHREVPQAADKNRFRRRHEPGIHNRRRATRSAPSALRAECEGLRWNHASRRRRNCDCHAIADALVDKRARDRGSHPATQAQDAFTEVCEVFLARRVGPLPG